MAASSIFYHDLCSILPGIAAISFHITFREPAYDVPIGCIRDTVCRDSLFFPGCDTFSDPAQYNSYDFFNSPVGLLERDSLRLRLNVGSSIVRLHAEGDSDSLMQKYTSWNVPDLLIGTPKIFYVRLFYAPTGIASDFQPLLSGQAFQRVTLPLQTFGLTLAGQMPSGLFQFAFQSKGYVGDEKVEDHGG
jgi:hypothetical protein